MSERLDHFAVRQVGHERPRRLPGHKNLVRARDEMCLVNYPVRGAENANGIGSAVGPKKQVFALETEDRGSVRTELRPPPKEKSSFGGGPWERRGNWLRRI